LLFSVVLSLSLGLCVATRRALTKVVTHVVEKHLVLFKQHLVIFIRRVYSCD
jgi:hypothetical protein